MDWEVRAVSLILCLGILLATVQNGIAEHRIVCYYSNWSVYRPGTAKFSPQNINPYLCTHLIYAFGGFTKENTLKPFDKYQDIEKGGYAKFTGLKTYNKNLKTMLAIGGWNEGSSRFSPMVADPARRREFVKNAVKFLRQNHFDGLDLDWEYPAFRDGGKPRDKDNYANLVQELREEFERESSKTGRPRLLLSMAVPAGIEYIDKGYDVPRLNEYLDFINLLSYDYHSAYEPAVNHHSPLYPLEEDNEYNYDAELTIDHSISHLLEKGASADKLVLGIPTYGRSYTLFNEDATDIGSPADGPGAEGEATREKGYLSYYEICEGVAASDEWEVVQPNPKAMGPYAFKGNQWVGYDDENIVKLKANYVNEKKLGGIMFWSIDNDDFRGKCHGRPYPLIEAAKEALLMDNRNTIDKTKSIDSRKKTRTRTQGAQSNAVARKSSTNSRRSSTTSAPISTKRVPSSRPKYRTASRTKTSDEDQEDREVSRRSYDPSTDEDTEGKNTVRITEKTEQPKNRNRSKTRSGSTNRNSPRKQSRRKGQSKTGEDEESLSNKLTTPEPPTTPDPGSDFKCEDEGFFPHPRDCKKYFWCLDSGPSGLGVVAHQFTCPSGLVFNKAADSCDYPRNVICPKTSKTSIVSTTRSPITAATSRTTYLHSTTTAKAESEEEYDSEEDYDEDEIEEDEEEEVKEEPKTTTTAKPLVYKTLTRSRPTTTSTTTTTTTTTVKPSEPERIIDDEDEEDPRVIKELIDLIKKAGGIEQLEKQLLFQERNSDPTSGSESVTPATISRSLYERVLSRQANRIGSQRPVLSSSETSYVNGPGRSQFEGLDDIPEVKNLRQKPQYVTIERPKSATKEDEDIDEDEEDGDNIDVATFDEESISSPLEDNLSTQRVTPNYVNIRRARPSTTTSRIENDVEEKEVEVEEERPTRRRRPFISSKQQKNEANSETSKFFRNRGSSFRNTEKEDDSKSADGSAEKNDDASTTKSRYISIQRFRSTTSKISEDSSGVAPTSELITETTTSSRPEDYPEVSSTTARTTISSSTTPTTPTTSTSTEVITVISVEPPENPSSVSPKTGAINPTTDSTKLEENTATEILLTTLPAVSSSSQPATTTTTTTTSTTTPTTTTPTPTTTTLASRSTIAAVSQPRPFGFTRRRSSLSDATTTTTTPSSRSKVADTEAIRLPTLRELVGYPTTHYDDRVAITTPSSVLLHLLRDDADNDINRQNEEESFGEANEFQAVEKELAQPPRNRIEEIGDTWLQQASKNKARSRALKSTDAILKERTSVIDPAPTTMRGIPLANLTSRPETRGFYITKSENDVPTSTSVDDIASSYSTANGSVEQRTETTRISNVSTTNEIVTVTYDNQNESNTSKHNDIISEKDVDTRGEKFSSSSYSAIPSKDSSAENLPDYKEFEVIAIPLGKPPLKTAKSRNFDYNTTPLPYVVSTTSPTRRKIAHAVNRYREAATPSWTGKRIVSRRRSRIVVSPIKNAVRQTESGSTRATASAFESASTIPLTSVRRKFPATIPPIVSESTISPDIFDSDDIVNFAHAKIDGVESRTTVAPAITSTNPIITTPSMAKITSATNDPTTVISTISDDLTTIRATTNSSVITNTPSTAAVAETPAAATESTFATTSKIETISVIANSEITPTIIDTTVIANDSVITSNIGVETTFATNANYSTDFTNTPVITNADIETIASDSATDVPTAINTYAIANNSVTSAPTNIGIETASTTVNYSSDITGINRSATTSVEVETTAIVNSFGTSFPLITNTIATDAAVMSTAIKAKVAATVANFAVTIPTNTEANKIDPVITTTPAATEITSTDYSTFTIPETRETIIPVTFPTVSSATNTHTTTNRNDPADADITTKTVSTIADSTAVTMSADSNISSTGTDTTSTSSIAPTEYSTTHFANQNTLDINENSEVTSVEITENPATFKTSPIFNSITSAISKSLPNSGMSLAATTAFSTQVDENTVTPSAETATVVLEDSTVLSTISPKSIATSSIIQATTKTYEPDSAQAISENSIKPEIKITSEEIASKNIQSRRQNRTSSQYNTANHHFGQKRRRVVNRTNNWLGGSVIQETNNQYPRHRITTYHERPRRPPSYASSSRVVEQNRRRITQKRGRVNSESISSTSRPDEHTVDVPNITDDRAENVEKRMKILKKVEEKFEEREITTIVAQETTMSPQSDISTKYETLQAHENGNIGSRRKVVPKRVKSQSQENFATEKISVHPDSTTTAENLSDDSQSNFHTNESFLEGKTKRRMRVVLKSVRPISEEKNSTDEANADLNKNLRDDFHTDETLSDRENTRRKMEVVLKNVRAKSEKKNATIEEASANSDSIDLQDELSNNSTASTSFPVEQKAKRRMRVVLKTVKPKSEEEETEIEETHEKTLSDESLRGTVSNNLRRSENLPVEYRSRRRMRVVLKSVKPKSDERNIITENATASPNSIDKDLRGNFSSNLRANESLSDEEKAGRKMEEVASKSVKPEERDSIAEETNAEPDIETNPQVIFTSNFPSEHVGDRENTRSKSEERKATIEQPEDTELQATATSVQTEEDTDRPSLEVNFSNNGGSINRKLDSGYFNRRRKLTQSTTTTPSTNTLPNTVTIHRRVRPIDTTLSPRIDFGDAFEDSYSYIKLAQNDQKADVLDQSIHAQEFAVTLADPSDTGRTALGDALRRKISTTITPRTDPTTSVTITSYSAGFRSRQRPRTKERPTVNATTRPRRPAVIDYDYYEDEVPIIVGKSNLNTKLFLTSKGTIRCLDQGNFPHPYSCKKFITCARMVNGQVIGTEYTCPNKLSFDPVGGICNWSAGLGCKD
ncbi:uncharacterized protein [Linepithema humile]|uniref:uncharacterized protein n=1 Tax=Linepithema humile TaxID=83485 RepID=UPI00351DEC0B